MRRHEFINEEIAQEIIQFIRDGQNRDTLLSRLDDYHDYDIAQALEELTPEERRELYGKMGAEWTAEIFAYYDEPETLLTELAQRGGGRHRVHGLRRRGRAFRAAPWFIP